MADVLALAFVSLFVATDPLGAVPLFLGLVAETDQAHRRRVILQSLATASAVGIIFLFVGSGFFALIGLTVPDFMVAGGILLLVIALVELIHGSLSEHIATGDVGVVPLGVPLIVGPAVLTMLLVLGHTYGKLVTVAAFLPNVALAGLIFYFSTHLLSLLGDAGLRAVTKVMSLMLAAFGVMLIRSGVLEIATMFSSR